MNMVAYQDGMFTPTPKTPIDQIKVDKSLWSWQNDRSEERVSYMLTNFDESLWEPVYINPDYFLLDGQHRLEVAKRMGLKFLDVVIENEESDDKTVQ
jgi:hypothetical protein